MSDRASSLRNDMQVGRLPRDEIKFGRMRTAQSTLLPTLLAMHIRRLSAVEGVRGGEWMIPLGNTLC